MNQDQIKSRLLELDNSVEDFTVTLSGKASKRANGLYHPESREIILHNKNFDNDNSLMYTAIHEFAHHIHFTQSPLPVTSRSHTTEFWDILHKLLFLAEEKEIYINIFNIEPEFIDLTQRIKEGFLSANGQLMKSFGQLLMHAMELCERHQASFYDYVDRVLGLHRTAARSLMKVSGMNISPEIGYENMKIVARIADEDKRREAEQAFLDGKSPDMVKKEFATQKRSSDRLERLMEEKIRIERSMERLSERLNVIEEEIQGIKDPGRN